MKGDLDFVDLPQGSGSGVAAAPVAQTTSSQGGSSLIFDPGSTIRATSHPLVALFHVLFKVLALCFYLFSSLFTSNFVFIFVLSVLLLSADFWVVKNVSGRRLVGLRWWNNVQEDGSTKWVFESSPDGDSMISKAERNVFWTALYLFPVCWSVLLIFDVIRFKFSYMLIPLVALAMSSANIVGYTRCSKDQRKRLNDFVASGVGSMMGNEGFRNSVVNWVSGGGGAYSTVNQV